jgi:hypothetical protein
MEVPWFQYYAFAEHALLFLKDDTLAENLYKRAAERAADPEAVAAMVEALSRAGHQRQAQLLAEHASSLGIAEIVLPAPPPAPEKTEIAH